MRFSDVASSGEPLAAISVPSAFRILAADRTAGWGSEMDDLDVGYIVGYRVEQPAT